MKSPLLQSPKAKVRDRSGDVFYLGSADRLGYCLAVYADRPDKFTYRNINDCEIIEDYTDDHRNPPLEKQRQ